MERKFSHGHQGVGDRVGGGEVYIFNGILTGITFWAVKNFFLVNHVEIGRT